MFSSKEEDWYTPLPLFTYLDSVFHFRCDPCTTKQNPLGVRMFYTKDDDGLRHQWFDPTFINPPYTVQVKRKGKKKAVRARVIHLWVQKALEQSRQGVTCVLLITSRTDTHVWQDTIFKHAKAVCFMRSRQRFSNSKNCAPFPSAIVVFSQNKLAPSILEGLEKLGWTIQM